MTERGLVLRRAAWCPWRDDLLLVSTQSDLHLYSLPQLPKSGFEASSNGFQVDDAKIDASSSASTTDKHENSSRLQSSINTQPHAHTRKRIPGRDRWIGDVSDLTVHREQDSVSRW